MSIPEKCTVLVVGGGPGGSYTASVLAREGIDTVLLEADFFPRYHVGESMLPSIRRYLKFIDLDETFVNHGFTKKPGAAFKMSANHREGFTDFVAAGGPDHYSWNVVRSEADDMIFRHAGKSGAKIFDGVKVDSVEFAPLNGTANGTTNGTANGTTNGTTNGTMNGTMNGTTNGSSETVLPNPGRPISASYTKKADGSKGVIKFDYIVDASGRVGILNTKYLKNRTYNKALKNVANWAYFTGTGRYGTGTKRENAPFFEALRDESGWAWFIPLHNGTTSVGIVMNQEVSKKKKAASTSTQDYFDTSLKQVPMLLELLGEGKQATDIKAASDYSYNASAYAFPYARIVGDSGCFIDPFFSSGVHLAITGGLAAGTTIAASIRGDCDETTAAEWHSVKVREGYTRLLLVVLSAYKQMRNQHEPVLSDFQEDNFDRAFDFFRPIIQGTADSTSKFTQADFSKTLDFLQRAFSPAFQGADDMNKDGYDEAHPPPMDKELSADDPEILTAIRWNHGRNLNPETFTTDVINGHIARLETGNLTLIPA